MLSYFGCITCANADQPKPWQMNLQDAATPRMEALTHMHDFLLIIIAIIGLIVIVLLGYTLIRFREQRNPHPSHTTHHTMLEIMWTTIPALIVLLIAVPSVKLIYEFDRSVDSDITLKVTGHQWYWSYEYEGSDIAFDSRMIPGEDLKAGDLRNLDVDNRVVLPVGKIVKFHITSADVIHAFAVPAFGIQKNAIPGRINETWVQLTKEGVYYGQCWAICGVNHGFMPIVIEVVSHDKYDAWVKKNTPAAEENTATTPHPDTPQKGTPTDSSKQNSAPHAASPGATPQNMTQHTLSTNTKKI